MQEMTEIISGLQGDIPANSRKGVPYVGDKYVIIDCKASLERFFSSILHLQIYSFLVGQR